MGWACIVAACGDDRAGTAPPADSADVADAADSTADAPPEALADTMPANWDQASGSVSAYLVNGRTTVTVAPGTELHVTLTYRIWNAADCPACMQQILIGIDGGDVGCAFDGSPGIYPGLRTEDASVVLHAPALAGAHKIHFAFLQEATCEAAKTAYQAHPPTDQTLFEIAVE